MFYVRNKNFVLLLSAVHSLPSFSLLFFVFKSNNCIYFSRILYCVYIKPRIVLFYIAFNSSFSSILCGKSDCA